MAKKEKNWNSPLKVMFVFLLIKKVIIFDFFYSDKSNLLISSNITKMNLLLIGSI